MNAKRRIENRIEELILACRANISPDIQKDMAHRINSLNIAYEKLYHTAYAPFQRLSLKQKKKLMYINHICWDETHG